MQLLKFHAAFGGTSEDDIAPMTATPSAPNCMGMPQFEVLMPPIEMHKGGDAKLEQVAFLGISPAC